MLSDRLRTVDVFSRRMALLYTKQRPVNGIPSQRKRDDELFGRVWHLYLFRYYIFGFSRNGNLAPLADSLMLMHSWMYRKQQIITIHDKDFAIDNYKLEPTYPPLVKALVINDIADPASRLLEMPLPYPISLQTANHTFTLGRISSGFTINGDDDHPWLYAVCRLILMHSEPCMLIIARFRLLDDAPSTPIGYRILSVLASIATVWFCIACLEVWWSIRLILKLESQVAQHVPPALAMPAEQKESDGTDISFPRSANDSNQLEEIAIV